MGKYHADEGYATLEEALHREYPAEPLKKLAKSMFQGLSGRKAEVIQAIAEVMIGDNLKILFGNLDETEQLAVRKEGEMWIGAPGPVWGQEIIS